MLHATNFLSFVDFGSHLHSITKTEHGPAGAGLGELEQKVSLPACQMPGTNQLEQGPDLSGPNTINSLCRQIEESYNKLSLPRKV